MFLQKTFQILPRFLFTRTEIGEKILNSAKKQQNLQRLMDVFFLFY